MLTEPDKITDKITRSSYLELFWNIIAVILSESLRSPLYNFTFNILVDLDLWMTLRMGLDL